MLEKYDDCKTKWLVLAKNKSNVNKRKHHYVVKKSLL